MKLVAATGNPHKLTEFRRILEPLGHQVLAPADVGVNLAVEENGETFLDNARIKARALHEMTGLAAFADDSGLCVDALDGRPGVHSARYGGEDLPHTEKVKLLLRELEGVPGENRTARFVAAIACVLETGQELCCQGICEGAIAHAPRGEKGFGYDPVFLVGERTFSELTDAEKDAVSHRGKALELFLEKLSPYTHIEQ